MNFKSVKKVVFALILVNLGCANAQNTTVSQDPKFEQLLNEKRKVNSGITLTTVYKKIGRAHV